MNFKTNQKSSWRCAWGFYLAAVCGASFAWTGSLLAQDGADVEEIGLLPQQKKAIEVSPDEANPFAIVAIVEEQETAFEDSTMQEQKIRSFFSDISVQGVTRSKNGYKVLIGDMILQVGDMVPPVVPNQTERLQVTKIDEESIEVSWVEDEDKNARSPQTRILRKELDVGPKVKTRLPGAAAGSDGEFIRRMGDQQEELRQTPNLVAEP